MKNEKTKNQHLFLKHLLGKNTDKELEEVLKKYGESINSGHDLIGDDDPTALFYLLVDKFSYLMSDNPDDFITEKGKRTRAAFNKIVKLVGPLALSSKQVIENRNTLIDPTNNEEDKGIILPDEPVIWAPNHGFNDDSLATVLAAKRNAWFLFGSLPRFFNTLDGVIAWANGVIMLNRSNKHNRNLAIDKSAKLIDMGIDEIIFPEGVLNKSPNKLSINLWPGVYRIAKEKNIKVVPVAHYKRELHLLDKQDTIHTVIDDPIDTRGMSEKAFLNHLRDIHATWVYLMMEKYGQSTREKELGEYANVADGSVLAWEEKLRQRNETVGIYDSSIETTAHYRNKEDEERLQVYSDIANIQNINTYNVKDVLHARQKVKELKRNNFQGRF